MQRNTPTTISPAPPLAAKAILVALAACLVMGSALFMLARTYVGIMEDNHRIQMRQRVDILLAAVAPIVDDARTGALSVQEATEAVVAMTRRMTFQDEDGSNYYFIINYDGLFLLQPFDPSAEGTDGETVVDGLGRQVAQTIIAALRSSPAGTFVSYEYTHPDASSLRSKQSYVTGIPELGIIVGTGCYMPEPLTSSGVLLMGGGGVLILLVIFIPLVLCMRKAMEHARTLEETITHLRKRESKLEDTEFKYRMILDNSIEGIAVLQGATIPLANTAFCSMTGYSQRELQQMSLRQIVHPDDAQEIEARNAKRLAGTFTPAGTQLRIVDKNGTVRWMQSNSSAIMWHNSPAVLSIFSDLTDLRTTQNALQMEKLRLRYFMDNAPFPMAVYSQDGYLRHVNRSCCTMWGVSEDTLLNNYNIFKDPQLQSEPIRSEIARAFKGETVRTTCIAYDSSAHTQVGTKHTISFYMYPALHPEGQVSDVILVHEFLGSPPAKT